MNTSEAKVDPKVYNVVAHKNDENRTVRITGDSKDDRFTLEDVELEMIEGW